jgi:Fe-S oxidoreductase
VSEYATANERLKEAKATGAKALVTSCPWCERNFKDTIKEFGERMEFIISLKSLERQSRLTQINRDIKEIIPVSKPIKVSNTILLNDCFSLISAYHNCPYIG